MMRLTYRHKYRVHGLAEFALLAIGLGLHPLVQVALLHLVPTPRSR